MRIFVVGFGVLLYDLVVGRELIENRILLLIYHPEGV